jgi:hypothetical protein
MDEDDAVFELEYYAKARCGLCHKLCLERDMERIPVGRIAKTMGDKWLASYGARRLICKDCNNLYDNIDYSFRERMK